MTTMDYIDSQLSLVLSSSIYHLHSLVIAVTKLFRGGPVSHIVRDVQQGVLAVPIMQRMSVIHDDRPERYSIYAFAVVD